MTEPPLIHVRILRGCSRSCKRYLVSCGTEYGEDFRHCGMIRVAWKMITGGNSRYCLLTI